MDEARDMAIERMNQEARDMGADAVVNIRFTTSQVMSGAAELVSVRHGDEVGGVEVDKFWPVLVLNKSGLSLWAMRSSQKSFFLLIYRHCFTSWVGSEAVKRNRL